MEIIKNQENEICFPEYEGDPAYYFYVCSECHGLINDCMIVCPNCKRRILWNG